MNSFMSFSKFLVIGFVLLVCIESAVANSTTSPLPATDECEKAKIDVLGSDNKGTESKSCYINNWEGYQWISGEMGAFANMAIQSSPATACSALAKTMPAINGSIAGFEVACKMAVSTCVKTCNSMATSNTIVLPASSELYKKNAIACQEFGKNFSVSMGPLIMAFFNNNQAMQGCDTYLKAVGPGGGSSVIAGDCTNPANASNPVCAGMHASAAAPTGKYAGVGAANRSSTPGGAAISGLGGNDFSVPVSDKKGGTGEAPAPTGGGSAGGGLGGGGGGAGAAKKKTAAGGPAEPKDTKMYGGAIPGAGPSGGSGSSSLPSGTAYSGPKSVFGQQFANQDQPKNGPDLSKYAPNMAYQGGRKLAGVTGPDGITGPDSNLFHKVSNQFDLQTKQNQFFEPGQ